MKKRAMPKPPEPMELEAIFALKHSHEVFQRMRDRIFATKCRPLEPYESYVERLSEGERIVILINGFVWEMNAGGLSQFLGNSCGDHAEDTLRAMRLIGATAAVEALEDARATIFPGESIPGDRRARGERLFAWEDADEERASVFYDRQRQRLGWCESVEAAVARWILAHRTDFT